MIRRLLFALSSVLPLRIISEGDKPYLERYYVCTIPVVAWRIYLHRFVGPDPDRGTHDHPWKWALSLILAGSYVEERQDIVMNGIDVLYAGPIWYERVRRFNFLLGTDFHRVATLDDNRDVWTLFIHHPTNEKQWGFARQVPRVKNGVAVPGRTMTRFVPFTYKNRRDWWVDAPRAKHEPRRQAL